MNSIVGQKADLKAIAAGKSRKKTSIQIIIYAVICGALFLIPLFMDNAYLLNKFSTYMVMGMLAMALSLSWGYSGILNLGQATSFGLGSYCMAMALKLRTVPIHTGAEGLPDFMVWNNVETLPLIWQPFHSLSMAIILGIAIPVIFSMLVGWFVFKGRVTGVYVAIITLAILVVVNLLIIDQQRVTGGFNGITDLAQLEIFGFEFDAYGSSAYYLIAIFLTISLFFTLAVTKSKTGKILQAIRDHESRVRYFGYDVANYQIFAFSISAGIAGLAGMLYTIVMEFASPTFLGVQISLSIVIWCAVGGRQSLLGAMLGAIFVVGVQGSLSESQTFLETWTLVMGFIFVIIVLFMPKGIAGVFEEIFMKFRNKIK
jgi:urea transport system permease protein